MNAVMGGKQSKPPSGLGGLASSFLGGQSSHSNNSGGNSNSGGGGLGGIASSFLGGQSSHNNNSGGSGSSGGGGGLAGQLMGSLLGAGKPQQPQSSTPSGGTGISGNPGGSITSSHQPGGLMGMASGFLGNHQKPPVSHKCNYEISY